jgi:phenylacetate-CoA ligase
LDISSSGFRVIVQRSFTCGKTLPLLEGIEGRSDDVLYTKDGRRIGRLDPIVKNDLKIIEAQIIQDSLNQ